MCVIKHLSTRFEFYPHKFGECYFFWRLFWNWWHPWSHTWFLWAPWDWLIRTMGIQNDWNSNTTRFKECFWVRVRAGFWGYSSLAIINGQTGQLLSEHTATLNVQISESEILRLYIDDILLDSWVEEFVEKTERTLKKVWDKCSTI